MSEIVVEEITFEILKDVQFFFFFKKEVGPGIPAYQELARLFGERILIF